MKYFNNNQGSAVMTTLFILFGILAVALIGVEVMVSGFSAYLHQGASTNAYYAAETGIEQALMLYKLDERFFHDNCPNNYYLRFNGAFMTQDVKNVGNASCNSSYSESLNKYSLSTVSDIDYKSEAPYYYVKVSFGEYVAGVPTPTGSGPIVYINSRGTYMGTSREIQVMFCIPLCNSGMSGEADSCGGICD